LDGALRLDLAQLQIGARRHVGITPRPALGELGEACQLMRREDPARDAQPAHEGVLRRRDVEETKEFMTKDIDALGEASLGGFGAQLVPHIERMRFALALFLGREILACGEEPVLRRAVDVDRVRRRRGSASGRRAAPCCDTSQEAVEILLLLLGEIGPVAHWLWCPLLFAKAEASAMPVGRSGSAPGRAPLPSLSRRTETLGR